jgi:hypothetical protein
VGGSSFLDARLAKLTTIMIRIDVGREEGEVMG